jgi:hypothetical protein
MAHNVVPRTIERAGAFIQSLGGSPDEWVVGLTAATVPSRMSRNRGEGIRALITIDAVAPDAARELVEHFVAKGMGRSKDAATPNDYRSCVRFIRVGAGAAGN